MSAAQSELEIEKPSSERPAFVEDLEEPDKEEEAALNKLTNIHPPTSSGKVIAVDLDDVLGQTNLAVAQWHNDAYGTNMRVEDFLYYYYWKNPYWGNLHTTHTKVQEFYATDRIFNTLPVAGSREGIFALKEMGYRLVIVTARSPDIRTETWEWVHKHYPGCFETLICTGQFKNANSKLNHDVTTKLSKAQVCLSLSASLLIDDSAENVWQCISHAPAIRCILFGAYQWNSRRCRAGDEAEDMVYDVRVEKEGDGFWKKDTERFESEWEEQVNGNGYGKRAKDWAEVIRLVKAAEQLGEM